jgi:hypothetical protein
MQYRGIYENGGFIFGVKRSNRLQAKWMSIIFPRYLPLFVMACIKHRFIAPGIRCSDAIGVVGVVQAEGNGLVNSSNASILKDRSRVQKYIGYLSGQSQIFQCISLVEDPFLAEFRGVEEHGRWILILSFIY